MSALVLVGRVASSAKSVNNVVEPDTAGDTVSDFFRLPMLLRCLESAEPSALKKREKRRSRGESTLSWDTPC